MSTSLHFRAYINPQAALSEAQQKTLVAPLAPSETYTEGRHGSSRQTWIDSLRNRNAALVPELFVLAKVEGGKDKRYADLLLAKDAVHDRGAFLYEASSGHRSDDRKQWAIMRDRAYAMLGGAILSGKRGKPPLGFTDREIEIMQAIMESRNYSNWFERKDAMEARGIKPPGRTWCLEKLPALSANVDKLIEITPPPPKYRRAPSWNRLKPPSQVYFIKGGEAVKIGRSTKPYERVTGLATSNHQKLELLATTPGGAAEEKALHKRFAKHHIKGEWFRYCPEIAKFIAGISRKKKRK